MSAYQLADADGPLEIVLGDDTLVLNLGENTATAQGAADRSEAAADRAEAIESSYWESNLYNPANATSGKRLNTATGVDSTQAADFVSDYIGPLSADMTVCFRVAGGRRHAVYSSTTLTGSKTFLSGGLSERTATTGSDADLFYWVRIGGAVGNINSEELYEGIVPLGGTNPYVDRTQMINVRLTYQQARERLFDAATNVLTPALKIDERNNDGLARVATNLLDVDDPSKRIDDYQLFATGDLIAAAGRTVLRVPVSPTTEYSFCKRSGVPVSVTSVQSFQYDSDGVYIAGTDQTGQSVTTHASAAEMLIEVFTAQLGDVMMIEGAAADIPRMYVPYARYSLLSSTAPRTRRYEGQKAWFLTDSIGVPATSWPFIVAQELGLANYPNDDINAPSTHGGSWSTNSQRPNVGGSSPEKRVNYGTEAGNDHSVSHFYNRIQYLDASRDAAFIQGGTNAWGTPFGGGMVAGDAAYVGDLADAIETYRVAVAASADPELTLDGRSTVGAMILTIHKMMELLPNSPIFWIGAFPRNTMYERSSKIGLTQSDTMAAQGKNPDGSARVGGVDPDAGVTLPEYVEIQERICGFFGVPFYNPFRRSILRPLIAANYAVNYKDATHPSDVVGQEKIGRDITRWIDGFVL